MNEADRVVRTFVFTDVVKSTAVREALVTRYGEHEGNQRFRDTIQAPLDALVERDLGDGELVSTAGDSHFLVFRDARRAVLFAVRLQLSLRQAPIAIAGSLGSDLPDAVQVRIGIHVGAATRLERGGQPDYDDLAIAIARRVSESARGDQILTTEPTWNQAGTIQNVTAHPWHGYRLKGVNATWTLYEILIEGQAPQSPAQRPDAVTSAPLPSTANAFASTLDVGEYVTWEPGGILSEPSHVFWPVRLRKPTLIHAAQAFVAAALQQRGVDLPGDFRTS